MALELPKSLIYRRAAFTTHLPVDLLYSPSHAWLRRRADQAWCVGLTALATRQLGETVDHGFHVEPGEIVQPGHIIGWIEGFKSVVDLYCVASGRFVGGNPALEERQDLLNQDPYGAGWVYAVVGEPEGRCVDVHRYCAILDTAIDRLLETNRGGNGLLGSVSSPGS